MPGSGSSVDMAGGADKVRHQDRVIAEVGADIDRDHAGPRAGGQHLCDPHLPEAVQHQVGGQPLSVVSTNIL